MSLKHWSRDKAEGIERCCTVDDEGSPWNGATIRSLTKGLQRLFSQAACPSPAFGLPSIHTSEESSLQGPSPAFGLFSTSSNFSLNFLESAEAKVQQLNFNVSGADPGHPLCDLLLGSEAGNSCSISLCDSCDPAKGSLSPFVTWVNLERRPLSQSNQYQAGAPCEHGSIDRKENDEDGYIRKVASASMQAKALMKNFSPLERAHIGAGAGGIAGAITYACLHPLDTVKTRLQARGASMVYSGPLDVVVKTFRNQGLLGFYSGISAVLVGSMFSSAVYFGTCELGKALLSQIPSFPPLAIPPLAGAMGNLVSSSILVPKEVITQRMQTGVRGRSWEVFLRTLEKEGVGGLYTGYSAALVRNLPASVLSFSTFEYLKAAWMKRSGKGRLEAWQSVTSGALAGAISAALTTPLDVVKTRLMTQARSMHVGSMSLAEVELQAKIAASTYKGITSTLNRIWIEEGWRGLTKGVLPRVLYSACFSALGYFAFETARLALVKRYVAKKKRLLTLSTSEAAAAGNVL